MGKYIKKFDTHSDYEDFIETEDFIKPNVSYCVDNVDVHYNPTPHDYSKDYLTFVALEDGTISFTYTEYVNPDAQDANYVEYSIDEGQTWTRLNNVSLEEKIITVNVSQGDKVLWRGDNSTLGMEEEWLESGHFSSSGKVDVMGNVMSILYGSNFENKYEIENHYALMGLFSDVSSGEQICDVVNAENLILPATTLSHYCYYSMFYGCTNLTTAPELPAVTLSGYRCYGNMFSGCTSLNYIKAMFTTSPGSDFTEYWVDNVSETGTFVKNSAATWNLTGANGIPTGWTVETANA